ncbi:MAG: ACP S-malonyltransferase [Coriobacteriia bacterium]|nr:ACP S-malonyltransferase [Coriobacteriia bacterium]
MTARFAAVFPGQGSQRHGMLASLPDPDPVIRLLDAAEALSGLDLRDIATDGTPDQLADTRAAQPLLYLADWAWGSALLEHGAVPVAFAGHSLGELAALAVAGAFSVEAGLELVVERSRLMARCAADTPGGMMAVIGMDSAVIAACVADLGGVWVANDNAPGQVVLSGTYEGLGEATRALSEAGARRLVPLNVAGPFHSPLMEPAAADFRAVLERAAFNDIPVPVVQNAGPTPATDAGTLRERLAAQITSPVRWTETMSALQQAGATVVVECGPGAVLRGLARRVDGLEAMGLEETGVETVVEELEER